MYCVVFHAFCPLARGMGGRGGRRPRAESPPARRRRRGPLPATMPAARGGTDLGGGAPSTSRGPTRASAGAPAALGAPAESPQPVVPAAGAVSPTRGPSGRRSRELAAPGAPPGRARAGSSAEDPPAGAAAPGPPHACEPATEGPACGPPVAEGATGGVAPGRDVTLPGRAADAERDLLAPPVVHVHGGPRGEDAGERSADFLQWVDRAEAITARNLVSRLFVILPETAARFIRLGSLYSAAAREASSATVGAGTGGGHNRARGGDAQGAVGAGNTGGDGLSGDGRGAAATRRFPPDDDRTPA